MCGIFGYFSNRSTVRQKEIEKKVKTLALLSESRGKEASGLVTVNEKEIYVYREPVSFKKLFKSPNYNKLITSQGPDATDNKGNFGIIGHSRLVTNGGQEKDFNNQPVIKDGIICVHNGIITNVEELWSREDQLERSFEIDTEIFCSLFRKFSQTEPTYQYILKSLKEQIEGTYTIAMILDDSNDILLFTNNGSLYICENDNNQVVFASEKKFLKQLDSFSSDRIEHIKPNCFVKIDLDSLKIQYVSFEKLMESFEFPLRYTSLKKKIHKLDNIIEPDQLFSLGNASGLTSVPQAFIQHEDRLLETVSSLKRCTRCLLPETFPLISFDSEGICSVCHEYEPIKHKGSDALHKLADTHRKDNGDPDCIVALSGGRDSCYTLHYVVNELKLTPLAYTYDWGMVTDLARRNIYRLCGDLGIEHILVSADINKKRRNIQKNINAWLNKPHLGMIPLFMSGDKQYISNALRIADENDSPLIIFGYNPYEHTGFKSRFAGVDHGNKLYYQIGVKKKLSIIRFYLSEILSNISYINGSLFDTVDAFWSSYVTKRDYVKLFTYINWDENLIQETLNKNYNWEKASDTDSTWRIGDGTASFYNYIYFSIVGFTENDTFYSNMIRENRIDRRSALIMVNKANKPRYDSMKWYCDIVGIDFCEVIQRINKIEKKINTYGYNEQ